jgi:hypothetical protein
MNDIGHRNIEDYLRDLISDGFGRQSEDTVDGEDRSPGRAEPIRSSSEPAPPFNPRKEKRNSTGEG